ncbi:Site-specific recombinase XerD [Thermoanaerobacter sp. YS13]|uniref:tyrosine-type recombinase/integrase n=1 Tax=Thermoanaerobacter sp. YS13 TaxID=1511746 RepID=UPI000574E77C|nr:site-specific integrase [Thermoanaerobacter sp. YS13]KHO63395.1 Site-specific recombinase XerD [Thermoanaerobacter sp. YS13]
MPGSIQKKGKNKYLLVVSAGFDITGKRIRYTKTITANSDAEAEKQLALFYSEVMKGNIRNDQQLTLGEYCKYWIETKEKKLAPTTIDGYKKLMKRINEALGHIRLSKLKPRHLSEFYDLLREENLAENTISHYHRFLHAVLETAYKVDKLIPENPAKAVIDPPTPGRPKPNFYDDEQTLKLLEALNNAPLKYKVFVILALETGTRRSELLGLEWKDIDFVKGIIYIQRASNYTKENGIYTGTTKTETSVRKITVSKEILTLLKEYRRWQNEERLKKGDKWIDTDRLFTQENGLPMHPDTPDKWFKKFLKRNNLPIITIHGLRHTNASIMIANNIDIITVAGRLGHADKSTPVRIYGHMLNKKEKQAAEIIANETLRKTKKQR